MSDSFLSQEEIDALLRNEAAPAAAPASANLLSDVEIDALGEIGNISMGSAAATMSVLLSRRVEITTPGFPSVALKKCVKNILCPISSLRYALRMGLTEPICWR